MGVQISPCPLLLYMAKLFLVATPIGNLEDITLRALRILREVDLVLCEDTRSTRKLLSHFDIKKPLESFHAHSTPQKMKGLLARLQGGESIAYVTDAGTPGVSDPGELLVRVARDEGISIETIPGASALAASVAVAGVPLHEFLFLGFLPHKKGRETAFKKIAASEIPVFFYESTHRILKALESLMKVMPNAQISLFRELTKIHEEVLEGTPENLLNLLTKIKVKQKGEFVVLVRNSDTK